MVAAAVAVTVLAIALSRGGGGGGGTGTVPPGTTARTAPGPAPAGAGVALGMNLNRVFNDAPFDDARTAPLLRLARAAGVRNARSDLFWEATERSPPVAGRHSYDWRFGDWVASSLARSGIAWLPIIDYAPAWASGVPAPRKGPPRNPADYAAFAGAAARRYGPGGEFWRTHPDVPARPVRAWEIWNEENSTHFWGGQPDAALYARMYAGARGAIHAADPGATVLVGGLTNAYESYVADMVGAVPALRGAIDGVAIHPYSPTVPGTAEEVRKRRAALRAAGLGDVPLWVTEYGWVTSPATSGHYKPEGQRAIDLPAVADVLARSDCGIRAIYPYTWTTPERNPASEEDWYGIVHPGGALSPSARAWIAFLRRGAKGPPVAICGGG